MDESRNLAPGGKRRPIKRRVDRRRLAAIAGSLVIGMVAATVGVNLASSAEAALAAPAIRPPSPPTSGLGSNGPCSVTATSNTNPVDGSQKIIIYNPSGSASTPLLGGRCDDAKRPVVVFIHGLGAGIDAQLIGSSLLYRDVVNHFASTGNVVVFATYDTNLFTNGGPSAKAFSDAIARASTAVALAPQFAPRGDFSRLGIAGHSLGGGAVPYVAQQAVARGWGSTGLWLFPLAPAFAANVGTGPIQVPSNTRIVVQNYANDNFVDTRLGIEQFTAYTVPDTQKKHITVFSQTRGGTTIDASHLAPNSLIAPDGPIHSFAINRVGDAVQSCTLTGANCDADLSYMGQWSDGQPVTLSVVTNNPVDVGPKADALAFVGLATECEVAINERAASCPPSSR